MKRLESSSPDGREVEADPAPVVLSASLEAERLLREIDLAAKLQHPQILPLYDSGKAGTFLYYVMPFVERRSLRDTLDQGQGSARRGA